ncbi:MATE family efflux transporter [Candidatus Thiothrix sp. Deng01]|uniref:MATE family efflux transporter n=1 Tax=Candidatus Thiothrix phosphatis TaxID=3112415 RepID=A0ABU6CYU2_9GAMM|nr:MATE family efflux transporter [Candidatus Thiothrix sp. Deng01]MEB4591259.1 MATE family efflux transporter [Candidatus Thiothrix sp. Deng01]
MSKRDLTTGSERDHLLQMTIPTIWGMLAIMSMHIVDSWFVGRLGADELAAMGFTFPIVMIIGSLVQGVGTGASSLIARAIGSGQTDWVHRYATHSLIIAFSIALAFAIVGLLTVNPLFRLLGAPEHLLPLIHSYMDTWYLGCFLIVMPMVGNAGVRAAGNTRLPSYVLISVAIIHVALNPLLIFGLFGFPRMELQGAALSTVISYAIASVFILYILGFRLKFLTQDALRQQAAQSWKAILRLAVPAASTNLIEPFAAAITTWIVAQYGSYAVAGYGVASRIEALSLIVLGALAATLAPFAGQNWGARQLDRLNRALDLSFHFAWLWGLGIAVLLWFNAEAVIGWFTHNPEAVQSAKQYLYIVSASFGLMGVVMIISSVANGMGAPAPALVMTLALLTIYLPLAWLLPKSFGLSGVYMAIAIANALVGLGAFVWAKRKCSRRAAARKVAAAKQTRWDQQYSASESYLYGTEPNDFLRSNAARLPLGKTLCIGAGEGRNAVFLAGLGHTVTALDAAEPALEKAHKLAGQKQVSIETVHADLATYRFEPNRWDAVVSIFCHLPAPLRKQVHRQVLATLRPGGIFLLEAYTPQQLQYKTGGPTDPAMLADLKTLQQELAGLEFLHAQETTREIHEGELHRGVGAVVQIIARRRADLPA